MKTIITLAAALTSSAFSAITYIDVNPTNTTGLPPADGTTVDGWRGRGAALGQGGTNFANQGGVYEASGASSGELATTISGLTPGEYDLYVFFWDDRGGEAANGKWQIDASLTSGTGFTNYTATPGTAGVVETATVLSDIIGLDAGISYAAGLADQSVTPNLPGDDGNRDLFHVNIGSVTVDGSGSTTIYVDRLTTGERTWYDGVGFEAVPEPSSALLGLMGALGLLRRRR